MSVVTPGEGVDKARIHAAELAHAAELRKVADEAREIRAEIDGGGDVRNRVLQAVNARTIAGIFHDYQKEAARLSHVHDLLVIEKGRRTGLTWAFAGDDVVTAATKAGEGGDDVFYIGPSFDMAREYIDACAGFAKAFMGIDAKVGEFMFDDEDENRPGQTRKILAFRINFASGHKIVALTSAPSSIRGRQGLVRIDEGAFHKDLEALLAAALPLIILGSRVVVISTHNGADSAFAKLIKEIRSGEQAGHVMTISFMTAVEQGIYERVATIRGWELTEEAKAKWVRKVYKTMGKRAAQELDVIPSKSAGKWLAFDLIERAEDPLAPIIRLKLSDKFAFRPEEVRLAFIQEWCERELKPWLADLVNKMIGLGGDYARYSDLSVIWLLEELPDRSWRTPFVVEMRNVPFTEQLFVWEYILRTLRRWKAKLDAHGSGGTLAERLQQLFGRSRVEAVKALAPWWMAQGTPLHSRFEDDRILVPRHADIATELRMVEVVNGAPRVPEARTAESEEGEAEDATLADDEEPTVDAENADGEDDTKPKAAKRHGDAVVALFHASAALREGADIEVGGETAEATGAPAGFLGHDDPELTYEPLSLRGY